LRGGVNHTRPTTYEVELAESLHELIPCAEMVKFGKNGSDATSAAVRLARAFTGRDLIAFPYEESFHSIDDWFMGATEMDAGVPADTKKLSLRYRFADPASLETLFAQHPGQIAAVLTEPAMIGDPPEGSLAQLARITRENGALFVFDEMITGFRWHVSGAQAYYGVTPDLATFGKGIGNGFSVSALAGRRDVMRLGSWEHDEPRVFLLSLTHGGETHALAAALATVSEMAERDVTAHLWEIGGELRDGLNAAAAEAGLAQVVHCDGCGCSPALVFEAEDPSTAAGLRTLFLQETIARGILMPYIAPSFSHGRREVELTLEAAADAFALLARVVAGEPLTDHLVGERVRPVFRRYGRG
jgi:glutamate-1-semialdehyde 2,1-aminomutase